MMSKNLAKIFFLICTLITLAGCAQVVPLNYYPAAQPTPALHTKNTLSMGQITDQRGVANQNLVFIADTVGAYGELNPIPYYTNQPVVNVVSNGINAALNDANYHLVSGNANLTLSGELVSLNTGLAPGFSLTNNWQTVIKMNLRLTDNKTGYILWNQLLTGSSYTKQGFSMSNQWVQTAFNQAMDNLVAQLVLSPTFIQALQR